MSSPKTYELLPKTRTTTVSGFFPLKKEYAVIRVAPMEIPKFIPIKRETYEDP